jgi:hypothetical protein
MRRKKLKVVEGLTDSARTATVVMSTGLVVSAYQRRGPGGWDKEKLEISIPGMRSRDVEKVQEFNQAVALMVAQVKKWVEA